MSLKYNYNCLLIFSFFLTTLSKHFLIETDESTSNSTSTDEEDDYDAFEDFVPYKPKVQGEILTQSTPMRRAGSLWHKRAGASNSSEVSSTSRWISLLKRAQHVITLYFYFIPFFVF